MHLLNEFADACYSILQFHCIDRLPSASIQTLSLDDAYAVQRMVVERQVAGGEQIVGYKVGCASRAIRAQFGLSESICGCLVGPHVFPAGVELDWRRLHQPAVKPEFVLAIGRDVTADVKSDEALQAAVAWVAAGIEVQHYDWWFGKPSLQELIATNGLHAGMVIGAERVSPAEIDWTMEGVGLFVNGELAASGIAAEIMGSPLSALRWLVGHLSSRGQVLRAGQLVIAGSPVRLVPVKSGDRVVARFTHVGSVAATFGLKSRHE